MSKLHERITEAILNTDLAEISLTIVRELAMACRKVGIYGLHHSVSLKAVEKPFEAIRSVFQYRNHVSFNIRQGGFYVLNVQQKDSPFTTELRRHFQALEINALLFDRRLTLEEFTKFLDRLVKKAIVDNPSDLMPSFLRRERIETIEVNTSRAFELFERHRRFDPEKDKDCSVKAVALEQIGGELGVLVDVNLFGKEALERHAIDYSQKLVSYLLPEKVASIPDTAFADICGELFAAVAGKLDDSMSSEKLLTVWRLLDYHPEREAIVEQIQLAAPNDTICAEIARAGGDTDSATRIETREQVDTLLVKALESDSTQEMRDEFVGSFQRLLGTGQRDKVIEVVSRLADYLNSTDTAFRGRALDLLIGVLEGVNLASDKAIFESLLGQIRVVFEEQTESFEYAEFVWRLFDRCLVQRRFDLVARLAGIVGQRRKRSGGITVYDSVGIKKIIENLNRSEIVSLMIDEMVRTDKETSTYIRDILIACGAEDAAVGLSHIISHPMRQVRERALKILAELGKASLKVFTQILMDDNMFDREPGRQELPDAQWYVVRNSVFVLGLLGDTEGIAPLRLRINDPDIRVRREILASLKEIGGEDACDLLILMVEDPAPEICERAVEAVGKVGTPDTAPLLIDAIQRNPSIAIQGMQALGRIGGEGAAEYLRGLLHDSSMLTELAGVNIAKDDLRLAIIESLGNIGDEQSVASLRDFKEKHSESTNFFTRNSDIDKALKKVLESN